MMYDSNCIFIFSNNIMYVVALDCVCRSTWDADCSYESD